jgi:hypothetical protein
VAEMSDLELNEIKYGISAIDGVVANRAFLPTSIFAHQDRNFSWFDKHIKE